MIKMVFLVHRRSEMEPGEFSRYWRESHAAIARTIPGLRKYIQNHATAAPDGSPPLYDGFAEMWFDDAEALSRALSSPEGQATVADTEKFIDLDRMVTFNVDEVNVI